MDNSPFAKLPAELRIRIYEYSLLADEPLIIERFTRLRPPHSLALEETCQAFRDECTKIFYYVNTFVIRGLVTTQVFRRLSEYRTAVGEGNANAIRSIILDIGSLQFDSFEAACYSFDELQKFLAQSARVQMGREWQCKFRARAHFVFRAIHRKGSLFYLDLDFDDIERSWEENIEVIRQVVEGDVAYWKKIRPMLETSRENLKVIMAESGGS